MKYILTQIYVALVFFLFAYTASSKFLDMHKFIFQMSLAPVPLMKTFAPTLGWIVPCVETLIVFTIFLGIFYANFQMRALYASVLLLSAFEVYIGIMLLSHSKLPCTCGGILSTMGWGQHLFFNAFFVAGGLLSIKYLKGYNTVPFHTDSGDDYQILLRA